MSDASALTPSRAAEREPVSCSSCRACCCRLEVILMGDDEVPAEMIESDRWGGEVMARLDDGWCIALDRDTMLCRIYDLRPAVCREFEVASNECLTERKGLSPDRVRAGG
ncbi:MAG: YkgJ family cysteine cluster protein [Gammaproteobacteria bacterium]|nr:YkgJ family cysteine cluster protein [Gammaproteobacteria bacterium]